MPHLRMLVLAALGSYRRGYALPLPEERYSEYECANALSAFETVSDITDVDRAIARLRLVPFYRSVCPDLDWDDVDRRL